MGDGNARNRCGGDADRNGVRELTDTRIGIVGNEGETERRDE